jgi:hypothetical protein
LAKDAKSSGSKNIYQEDGRLAMAPAGAFIRPIAERPNIVRRFAYPQIRSDPHCSSAFPRYRHFFELNLPDTDR